MQKIKSFIRDKKETVIGAIILLLLVVLSAFLDKSLMFLACLALFLGCVGYIVYNYVVKYKFLPASSEAALSSLTVDVLMKLGYPVLMVGDNDSVVWYNKAFSDIKELTGIKYGQNLKGLFGGALCYSVIKNKKEEFNLEVGESFYNIYSVEVSSYGKNYFLTIWTDSTSLRDAKQALKMRNVVVGYAAVDNAAEVASYLQEHYRSMIAKAYSELYSWVNGMNGIVREYDRDKYMIFVDEENFTPNIAKKFDILDKINTAVAGDGNRLTLSMSFVVMEGTLAEKEAAANEALEYAFQRGGAQIIVKNKDGNLSFGGQSRAVEKTTKIKSRVTADRLKSLISNSSNVIIMGHKNIDVDAVASACAVARLAMYMEKKVNIVVNVEDGALDSSLAFIDDLREYDDVFIDRVRGQELLSPNTLVVIVDASNAKIFESYDIYINAQNVAIIDHHVQTNEFETTPKLQYIDPTASSASELMCEILEQAIPRSALKSSEAELLLAGILLDTQRFTRNTGVRTFGAAMYLRPDAKMMTHARSLFKPDIKEYTKQAVFQKNTIVFRGVIGISHYEDDNLPENRIMASIAAEGMLNIAAIKAAFALCTIGDDVHISARSDGSINVAKILESLNGGGRFEAAATVLKSTGIKEGMTMLRKAIEDYWSEKFQTGGNS